jgi:hypothetical protein
LAALPSGRGNVHQSSDAEKARISLSDAVTPPIGSQTKKGGGAGGAMDTVASGFTPNDSQSA